MPVQVIFHGTKQEAIELTNSFNNNCTCDNEVVPRVMCPGHALMLYSQREVDALLFYKRIKDCLMNEEFRQR